MSLHIHQTLIVFSLYIYSSSLQYHTITLIMATCACALCIHCLRRCRICPHSPPDQCPVPESAPPDCYTSVPLVRIFDVSNHLPLSMVHSDARKLSLITEQQTLFYSATLLSPKAPVPTPSAAARRASSLFAFSSSPSLVSCKLEKHQSCVDFMIFYDIQSCAFTVKLLNVRSLPPMNSDGFVNSYVTLYLLPHKEQVFRSKTCQKDLDPMIYQIFVFDHIPFNEISTRTLVLRVYNAKTNRHTELIGNVVLPLRKAELHGVRVSAVLNQLEDIDNVRVIHMYMYAWIHIYIPQLLYRLPYMVIFKWPCNMIKPSIRYLVSSLKQPI